MPGTVAGYCHRARPFVAGRLRGSEVVWARLTASDVTGFVLSECPGRGVGTAKLVVCALRSLLSWLHLSGQVSAPLAQVVPAVAGWPAARMSKALTASELAALLVAADRDTVAGRRDNAVLLLSRLGLRAGEVARLALGDSDWRAGTLQVRGRGNRVEAFAATGRRGGRDRRVPAQGASVGAFDRSVFIRVHAPAWGLTTGGITMIVFGAAARAGLPPMHAHRQSRRCHGDAWSGGTLVEVGQVLRHRSVLSTAIYAKVDIDRLQVLAREWPATTSGDRS